MALNMFNEDFIQSKKTKDGSMVTLRPIRINDANDIVDGAKSIVTSGEYIQKESVRNVDEERKFIIKMKQQGNMYIGAELGNKIVGIARVIRGDLDMKRHTGVFRTWLVENAQGKGIGTHLLNYTFDWCERNLLQKLWLTVFSSNNLAHKLYQKYGFEKEGVQKQQLYINGQYEDEIFLAKFFK